MPRLYAAITPHGYGHGAITASVLAGLAEAVPGLELAVVGGPPEAWMRERLPVQPVFHDRQVADPGMVNSDPNTVEAAQSLRRYREIFENFEAVVAAEMERLRRFRADVVVSNVGFVSLEAARRLGIPGIAMGPFHWGQIFGAYCGSMPGAREIVSRLSEIYSACDMIVATTPYVPMAAGMPLRSVGPICTTAAARREDLRKALGIPGDGRVMLVAMGGIAGVVPTGNWPRFPGWHILHRGLEGCAPHPDVVSAETVPLSFGELVASVDVVFTKPGYGTVTECACAGTPILYRSRNDWPETPHMMGWAARHVAVQEVDDEAFRTGAFQGKLQSLLQAPRRDVARPTGVGEAVALLRPFLSS